VIDAQTYMIELLHYVLGEYHAGQNLLGDISNGALRTYVGEADMGGDPVNVETVFRHVLLGDPALKIPVRPSAADYPKPTCTAQSTSATGSVPTYSSGPVTITAATASPSVEWKWINVDADDTLNDSVQGGPTYSYEAASSVPALYLVRTAGEAAAPGTGYAKENWLFYKIEAAGSPKMHVSAISMAVKASGSYKYATATVTLASISNAPVAGATVSGYWTGLAVNSGSATTDTKGQAAFRSNAVGKSATGTFTFCVSNAVLTGWVYDSAANTLTCKSINTP